MMRVLITGSRNWEDERTIWNELDHFYGIHGSGLVIVHGGCPSGADTIAEAWASEFDDVRTEVHPADWERFGRSAGMRRNAEMVKLGADVCLAFIRDGSPGATGCAWMAEAAGIKVHYFTCRGDTDE